MWNGVIVIFSVCWWKPWQHVASTKQTAKLQSRSMSRFLIQASRAPLGQKPWICFWSYYHTFNSRRAWTFPLCTVGRIPVIWWPFVSSRVGPGSWKHRCRWRRRGLPSRTSLAQLEMQKRRLRWNTRMGRFKSLGVTNIFLIIISKDMNADLQFFRFPNQTSAEIPIPQLNTLALRHQLTPINVYCIKNTYLKWFRCSDWLESWSRNTRFGLWLVGHFDS